MGGVDYVMTVSGNGQVSIPADVRARWQADARVIPGKVRVVDLGDRVVLAPAYEDPVGVLRGKYAGRGPRSTDTRRDARREETEAEARKQSRRGGYRPTA